MSAALAPRAPSLFELEEELAALLDSADLVTEEQEQQFQQELAEAMQRSVEKRDRVAQFITHCCQQQQNCDAEIKRLTERKRSFQLAEKRMKDRIMAIIEYLGTDEKGRYRKLEGKTATFRLRDNPASVVVTDEEKIPDEFVNVSLTLPKAHLHELVGEEMYKFLLSHHSAATCPSLSSIKKAINAGQEVPGADLSIGSKRLEIR